MRLYFWTENEYDSCNHHAAFADSEEQARDLVVAGIRASYVLPETEPESEREYYKDWEERDVADFLNSEKWVLSVHEIQPGVVF